MLPENQNCVICNSLMSSISKIIDNTFSTINFICVGSNHEVKILYRLYDSILYKLMKITYNKKYIYFDNSSERSLRDIENNIICNKFPFIPKSIEEIENYLLL